MENSKLLPAAVMEFNRAPDPDVQVTFTKDEMANFERFIFNAYDASLMEGESYDVETETFKRVVHSLERITGYKYEPITTGFPVVDP